MRIVGPEDIVFGVDDVEGCRAYFRDYGLCETDLGDGGFRLAAADGTSITLRTSGDPALPPPLASGASLRQTIWGCEDQAAVDEIARELARDRPVQRHEDGSIATRDDLNFEIAFRVTTREPLAFEPERVNCPGIAPERPANVIGVREEADASPLTLSHLVYFTPDAAKMEAFYATRLGFVVTDRFNNVGPFMRTQVNDDHHCLFMLQTPPHMQGLEHLAFHVQGPTALLLAGSRMVAKGYESFWGPGRHKFGSNWFWYFNSPLGVHIEYDADMDKHDGGWVARSADASPFTSQLFLFENVERWFPGGPPPRP